MKTPLSFIALALSFIYFFAFTCCGRGISGVEITEASSEQIVLIDRFIVAYSPQDMQQINGIANTNADFIKIIRSMDPEFDIFEIIERRGFLFLCFRVRADQKNGDQSNILNSIIIDKIRHTYRIQALAKS